MRRIIVIAIAFGALAVPAARASHYRTEFGIVGLPAPTTAEGPFTDPARCTRGPNGISGDQVFGVVLELRPDEGDGMHAFALLDGQMGFTPPPTNFDITFFADLGSCDPLATVPPSPERPPVFARPGNEDGMIPAGMRWAIVTTTDGAEVPFELRIFG